MAFKLPSDSNRAEVLYLHRLRSILEDLLNKPGLIPEVEDGIEMLSLSTPRDRGDGTSSPSSPPPGPLPPPPPQAHGASSSSSSTAAAVPVPTVDANGKPLSRAAMAAVAREKAAAEAKAAATPKKRAIPKSAWALVPNSVRYPNQGSSPDSRGGERPKDQPRPQFDMAAYQREREQEDERSPNHGGGLFARPWRRAQHFTLSDIEEMRYKEAIRDCPRYAELWWAEASEKELKENPNGSTFTSIQLRTSNPVYQAKKALDHSNLFRGRPGEHECLGFPGGMPPLRWHDGIANIAAEHARDMAAGRAPFNHDGFDQRVARYPVYSQMSCENLAYNKGSGDPAAVAVQGWIHSPGHRKNLLSLTNLCGIGAAQSFDGTWYFTQLFARTTGGLT